MRPLLILVMLGAIFGCASEAVQTSADITTSQKLNPQLITPVKMPVAILVDRSKPENRRAINFYGILGEAAELVGDDLFLSSEMLTSTSDFQYLFNLGAISTWNSVWGTWNAELSAKVYDRSGDVVFTGTFKSSASGGMRDVDAIHSSLAEASKEAMIAFLNQQGPEKIQLAESQYDASTAMAFPLKSLFQDAPPSTSGTGFFIDNSGHVLSAAHVVAECAFVEMQHQGKPIKAEVEYSSQLLDLAVIKTDYQNSVHAALPSGSKPKLGKQVFVTGFPLAGILSDYPSLTVGNISSIGGLKGAQGSFQFSAPVQPGNSGGAIVDYQGNLVGLVSSSLNQAMMLQEAGTVSQNVNFGIDPALIEKFLQLHDADYMPVSRQDNFEKASADAVEYTVQVLCYK